MQGIDTDSLKCIAMARSCSVHVALNVEEDTTKDTDDDWITQSPTSLSWDVQVEALVGGDPNDTGATAINDLVVGRTYLLKFTRTLGATGEKNRDAVNDDITYIGYAVLNDYDTTAQITSAENLIAAGVDGIICGPMDLSASVGKMGKYYDPEVMEMMQTIIDKCKAHGKPFGLSIGVDMKLIKFWIEQGASFLSMGTPLDYFREMSKDVIKQARAIEAER